MKYLFVCLIFLVACGSGSVKPKPSPDDTIVPSRNIDTSTEANSVGDKKFDADTGHIANTGDTDAVYNNNGTGILFVGVFATWHQSGGDNFDGLYDSTQSLFSLCSTNKVEHVVASQISYDQDATCDTTNHKRVMLFMKDSLGNLNPNGISLNVVGNHAYMIGKKTREVKLSPSALDRIKATKVMKLQNLHLNTKDQDSSSGSKQPSQGNPKISDQLKSNQTVQPAIKAIEKENVETGKRVNHVLPKAAATRVQK